MMNIMLKVKKVEGGAGVTQFTEFTWYGTYVDGSGRSVCGLHQFIATRTGNDVSVIRRGGEAFNEEGNANLRKEILQQLLY